jgi:thiol-disulfide isomerase/thioredoxin
MLNESKCTIDNDLKKKLETYRKMKQGNIAPNIEIVGDIIAPGHILNKINYLSDINSKYKVLIFGASWCHKCSEELLETAQLYPEWKRHDIEVIFISLDEEKQLFQNYVKIFPFISVCDYKKWDSMAVKDFYVSSTPTIYLLDDTHKILLRPNSVKHLDTWIDWVLVKGHGE